MPQPSSVIASIWLGITALVPGLASAQSAAGSIYSALSVASDYRYNGVSLSNNEPVLQGYAHWQQPRGYYAGIFATGVDFNDPSNTSYELDFYTGRKFGGQRRELSFELLYSSFPEKDFAGPTYDFLQLESQLRTTLGRTSLSALATWTPEGSFGSGSVWRIAADARRTLTPRLSVSGAVGRRWIERGTDRTYWDLGLTFSRRRLALDLRYIDTNSTRQRCGFNPDVCGAAVVAVLTWSLPVVALR